MDEKITIKFSVKESSEKVSTGFNSTNEIITYTIGTNTRVDTDFLSSPPLTLGG